MAVQAPVRPPPARAIVVVRRMLCSICPRGAVGEALRRVLDTPRNMQPRRKVHAQTSCHEVEGNGREAMPERAAVVGCRVISLARISAVVVEA